MPEFAWHARTMHGTPVRGLREAPDVLDLTRELAARGLILTRYESKGKHRLRFHSRTRLSRKERILITQQLASSLGAGITLIETLGEFVQGHPKASVRRMFESVLRNVEGGEQLSDALVPFTRAFPPAYVETVRAAERSGQLAQVFDRLAADLEWQDEIAARVSSAMVYPALLFTAVVGVAVLFLLVLLPKFEPVFETVGTELPTVTRVLLGTGEFVRTYGLLAIIVIPGFAWGVRHLLRTPRGRWLWDRVKLRLPIVHTVLRHLLVARFAGTLSTLLNAGVGLPDAMSISGRATNNVAFASAIDRARDEVVSGSDLEGALRATGHFRRMDLRMVAVGERSGEIVDAFGMLARLHGKSAKRAIEAAVTLVEPMMVLAMAGMVLGLAMAILLPVYRALDSIGR